VRTFQSEITWSLLLGSPARDSVKGCEEHRSPVESGSNVGGMWHTHLHKGPQRVARLCLCSLQDALLTRTRMRPPEAHKFESALQWVGSALGLSTMSGIVGAKVRDVRCGVGGDR